MGDQLPLGAIPMDGMNLALHPRDRSVDVNPANPGVASRTVKTAGVNKTEASPTPLYMSNELVDAWSQYVTAPPRFLATRTAPSWEMMMATASGTAKHNR